MVQNIIFIYVQEMPTNAAWRDEYDSSKTWVSIENNSQIIKIESKINWGTSLSYVLRIEQWFWITNLG